MKRNFRHSHTWGDRARDERRLHHNIQQVLVVERNGLVFALVRTDEHERPELLPDAQTAERRLSELVEDGFEIFDPDHLLDLWGVLTDDATSVAALDTDSAGYPSYPQRVMRRWDDEVAANIEVAYLKSIGQDKIPF